MTEVIGEVSAVPTPKVRKGHKTWIPVTTTIRGRYFRYNPYGYLEGVHTVEGMSHRAVPGLVIVRRINMETGQPLKRVRCRYELRHAESGIVIQDTALSLANAKLLIYYLRRMDWTCSYELLSNSLDYQVVVYSSYQRLRHGDDPNGAD